MWRRRWWGWARSFIAESLADIFAAGADYLGFQFLFFFPHRRAARSKLGTTPRRMRATGTYLYSRTPVVPTFEILQFLPKGHAVGLCDLGV